MTRHKKFLKSEKAKIKLKGAKLPKGLNVTKTDFKVKKIVIREQIKDSFHADGTVTRSENIKGLLSKLQHHNVSHRNEGLHFLKDMFANHTEETKKQLGTIIKGLAPLSLDVERNVRRECFKALNILLSNTTPETLQPFFDILTSYLKCAMTHIQMSIQEDSLFLLDSLLLHSPMLVADNSDTIFSCFLDMISKLRVESKPERTLSINLGSKMVSVKWRTKVMDRLLGMLKAMCRAKEITAEMEIEEITNASAGQPLDAFTLTSANKMDTLNTSNYFEIDKPMNFSLSKKYLNQYCELPNLFRLSGKPMSQYLSNRQDESCRIKNYTELLMPLIFETWQEIRPGNKNECKEFDDVNSILSNEAAYSLKIVLEIICNIQQLIKYCDQDIGSNDLSEWFAVVYNRLFVTNFLIAFPYSQMDKEKDTKRKLKDRDIKESGGEKCFYQNLMISHLFCCLNKTLTGTGNNQRAANKVLDYITNNISNSELTSQNISTIFVNVLQEILLRNSVNWLKTTLPVKHLLKSTIQNYERNKFPKEIKTKILLLLCDIILEPKLLEAFGDDIFDSWISTLPQHLCTSFVSKHVLKTFSTLARQKNIQFLQSLAQNLPSIIANLNSIKVGGFGDKLCGQREIVNLFYWIDDVSTIEQILSELDDDEIIKGLIKNILFLKKLSS